MIFITFKVVTFSMLSDCVRICVNIALIRYCVFEAGIMEFEKKSDNDILANSNLKINT